VDDPVGTGEVAALAADVRARRDRVGTRHELDAGRLQPLVGAVGIVDRDREVPSPGWRIDNPRRWLTGAA
jgi:hypothetical protein